MSYNRYMHPDEYYLHQRQRQYDDSYYYNQHNNPYYYQSLPKKRHSGQNNRVRRSLSTGNMQKHYHQNTQQPYFYDEEQQDYNWYYKDNNRPHAPINKRGNSKSNDSSHRDYLEEDDNDETEADDLNTYYEQLDGEPLNDRELLALKNAAINKRKSKIVYIEEEILKHEIQNNEPKTSVEQVEDISDQMSELTLTQSTPEEPKEVQKETTKKRWPFSFLFKKGAQVPVKKNMTASVQPTKSTSTPPTPILSPNNDSILSSPTTTSSSTAYPNLVWAFRFPAPNAVWFRFDNENQRKLFSRMNQSTLLELHDSHLPGIPIVVIPSQRTAYYMTNINQLKHLEISLL